MLTDKVAIVTGASSGIGRAAALLFAREGAAVVANARGEAELQKLVSEIEAAGGRAVAVAGDVAEETHRALLEVALGRFGGLDIALNNAGTVGPYKPLGEVMLEEWQHILAMNLTSAFLGARSQIPAMLERGGGSIIFTSTFVGTSVGIPGMGAYGASRPGSWG